MRFLAGVVAVVACVGSGPIGWSIGLAGVGSYAWSFYNEGKNVYNTDEIGYMSDGLGFVDWNEVKITKGSVTKNAASMAVTYSLLYGADYLKDEREKEKRERYEQYLIDAEFRDYQIQLSQYNIDAGYYPLQVIIHVTTKSPWEIINASVDTAWCSAYKSDNETIIVDIKDYFGSGSRYQTFTVQNPYDQNNVKPVYISVTQTGLIYTMIPNELNFEAAGGTKSFAIQINNPTISVDNIVQTDTKKWCNISWDQVPNICTAHVTALPNDSAERSDNLFVTFKFGYEENQKLGEIIKVTQKSKEGTDTTEESQIRAMLIKLYHDTDGDHWTRKDNWLSDAPILTWYGIDYWQGSLKIWLGENNLNGSIDVSGCTCLTSLIVSTGPTGAVASTPKNHISNLNISGCTNLTTLWCWNSELTNLNVNGCSNLPELDCGQNSLTNLVISGCTNLIGVYCNGNKLINLDISACSNLINLDCTGNQLTSLDASNLANLQTIDCRWNLISSLNVNGCSSLKTLRCLYNKILSEIPAWFSQIIDFEGDARYSYFWQGWTQYIDNGVGWWYPGEPESGHHAP